MRRAAVALALLAACHPRVRAPAPLEPLAHEGEALVYLQPFPDDAARLSLSVGAISALRSDGGEAPLAVALAEVSAPVVRSQRLLAAARLPPGPYVALLVTFRRATLATDEGAADLLASQEPVRIDVPFVVGPGRAIVIQLALRGGQGRRDEFEFGAAFSARALRPENTVADLAGYCSTAGGAELLVLDRRARQVTAALPTGRTPQGIALDVRGGRLFVALAAEDEVRVLDVSTGADVRRVALRTGDGPRELALTPDGRLLVVVNQDSNSVTFVDATSTIAQERLAVGEEPWALQLDRAGRWAYVLNRRSNSITVLDLARRGIVATIPTDPEPLRAQLNRDGTRLYVIHRGSAYLNVYSVPALSQVSRVFVGLGASALKVDSRTDLVYVGRDDEYRIQLFDPASLLPLGAIEVPGPVSYLTIDDVESTLVAVLASSRQIAFIDLASKRVVSTLDVPREPYQVVLATERF